MFRHAFAFVVIASALTLTGCSKCSEQPAATPPATEAPAVDAAPAPVDGAAAPADTMAPATDGSAAPAPDATPAAN